jgi:hypothetical protein
MLELVCTNVAAVIPTVDVTDSPSNDPILPDVYSATVACIYNVDRKCKGMITSQYLTKGL